MGDIQGRAPTGSPPAGWYNDPSGNGYRWWDGARWTDYHQFTRPVAPRASQGMTAGKLLVIIIVGIVLAVALMRGVMGATGAHPDPNQQPTPSYQVVPCDSHPTAIGC